MNKTAKTLDCTIYCLPYVAVSYKAHTVELKLWWNTLMNSALFELQKHRYHTNTLHINCFHIVVSDVWLGPSVRIESGRTFFFWLMPSQISKFMDSDCQI